MLLSCVGFYCYETFILLSFTFYFIRFDDGNFMEGINEGGKFLDSNDAIWKDSINHNWSPLLAGSMKKAFVAICFLRN